MRDRSKKCLTPISTHAALTQIACIHGLCLEQSMYIHTIVYIPLLNVPILTGTTTHTVPSTDEAIVLIFHKALYYGIKLNHSLINPNQLHYFDIDVQGNPYDPYHDVTIDVEPDKSLQIPLTFEGTKGTFKSRVPTEEEINTCYYFNMTSDKQWEPTGITLGEIQTKRPTYTKNYE